MIVALESSASFIGIRFDPTFRVPSGAECGCTPALFKALDLVACPTGRVPRLSLTLEANGLKAREPIRLAGTGDEKARQLAADGLLSFALGHHTLGG